MTLNIEIEQHTAIRRHSFAPHQADGALLGHFPFRILL